MLQVSDGELSKRARSWESAARSLLLGVCHCLGVFRWESAAGSLLLGVCRWESIAGILSLGVCRWGVCHCYCNMQCGGVPFIGYSSHEYLVLVLMAVEAQR